MFVGWAKAYQIQGYDLFDIRASKSNAWGCRMMITSRDEMV